MLCLPLGWFKNNKTEDVLLDPKTRRLSKQPTFSGEKELVQAVNTNKLGLCFSRITTLSGVALQEHKQSSCCTM